MNKIWIELEKPENDDARQGICDKANLMLRKLGFDHAVFMPNLGKHNYAIKYIAEMTPGGGFTQLEDNGQWFNLDHLIK